MTRDDVLKDQYDGEFARRDQMAGSLSLPIAILTVFSGALLTMTYSLTLPLSLLEWLVLVLVAAAGMGAVTAGYLLFRFQLGHDYSYVATAKQLDDYRNELLAYYARHSQPTAGVDDEVLDYIRSQMIASAHDNAVTNARKSGFLTKAYVALAGCASLTLAAGIPYTGTKLLAGGQIAPAKAASEVR